MKRLTKKQAWVVNDLKTGGSLITDSSIKGAWVGFDKHDKREDYHIGNGVFWRLVKKNIIRQQTEWPFNYILY